MDQKVAEMEKQREEDLAARDKQWEERITAIDNEWLAKLQLKVAIDSCMQYVTIFLYKRFIH